MTVATFYPKTVLIILTNVWHTYLLRMKHHSCISNFWCSVVARCDQHKVVTSWYVLGYIA